MWLAQAAADPGVPWETLIVAATALATVLVTAIAGPVIVEKVRARTPAPAAPATDSAPGWLELARGAVEAAQRGEAQAELEAANVRRQLRNAERREGDQRVTIAQLAAQLAAAEIRAEHEHSRRVTAEARLTAAQGGPQ